MRKLIITVLFVVLAVAMLASTPTKATKTVACTNCCSWTTDCSIGFRCCTYEAPCSTEPLRYGRCEKVKVCGQ